MKKLLLLVVLVTSLSSLNAAVWRVNNIPGTDAHFSSIQEALNSPLVAHGDTIYLEPSTTSYGNIALDMQLVIIGPGYFLTENPETQANMNTSQLGTVIFNNGSQGAIIQGCQISNIQINTSDVIIERNMITSSSTLISLSSNNIGNIIIRNNYISATSTAIGISSNRSGIYNVLINNNLIRATSSSRNVISLSNGFSGTIKNNVIELGSVIIINSEFKNNILANGNFEPTNSTWHNNIGNANQFGNENGNQSNVSMSSVFKGSGSTDGQWQLRAGSPAIGAGYDGEDCGMFGGEFPYVLSGIPGIPAIYYHHQVIDNIEQQLDVIIRAKSHN